MAADFTMLRIILASSQHNICLTSIHTEASSMSVTQQHLKCQHDPSQFFYWLDWTANLDEYIQHKNINVCACVLACVRTCVHAGLRDFARSTGSFWYSVLVVYNFFLNEISQIIHILTVTKLTMFCSKVDLTNDDKGIHMFCWLSCSYTSTHLLLH